MSSNGPPENCCGVLQEHLIGYVPWDKMEALYIGFPLVVDLRKKLKKLKLIYFDICSPIDVETHGRNKNFVIFIDDFTKKVWIYLLKLNDQIF